MAVVVAASVCAAAVSAAAVRRGSASGLQQRAFRADRRAFLAGSLVLGTGAQTGYCRSHGVAARHTHTGVRCAAVTEAPPPTRTESSRTLETDIVVIGSGIGGLCAGALLARYGYKVIVCESHVDPGGAAHEFKKDGYTFESGPSLYSGMCPRPTTNPLGQVLHALDVDLPCIKYDAWYCHLPEGSFLAKVGAEQFHEILKKVSGPGAVKEWDALQERMKPYMDATAALPAAAIREDPAALITLARFLPALLKSGPVAAQLSQPFSELIKDTVKDPFVLRWLDLLCFLLSGLPADGTVAAEMAFMLNEWYQPGCHLEFPKGGSGAIIQALVTGLEKYGGRLLLGTHVEQVLVENGKAAGVVVSRSRDERGLRTIRARKAVVSNASVWDTLRLVPDGAFPARYVKESESIPQCKSFIHLHLGIDATGLPDDLEIHHMIVNSWENGITAPQNVVVVSIPSVLDPSLAPHGKHVVHAYTPATEPWSEWEGLKRGSPEYEQKKQERAEVLWKALEKAIPDVRQRTEVTMIGTPITHGRYLRRDRGTYGPAIKAGQGMFPGHTTPLPGLYTCGDSTFPGIGVPAVAASGIICANTLAPVWKHWELLDAIGA
eukprot:jgi/Chlat1/7695/Chrsp64S00562